MLLFFNYREFIVWVFLPFPDRPRIFKPLDLIHPVKTVERENVSSLVFRQKWGTSGLASQYSSTTSGEVSPTLT